MAILDEFFAAPSVEILDKLTKDQLRQVCQHYNFDVGLPKSAKLAQIKVSVEAELVVRNILPSPLSAVMEDSESGKAAPLLTEAKIALSFEQHKELIEMQQREREAERKEREAQREADRQEREAQREAERRERDAERELELERIKSDRELALERLRLVAEGKLSSAGIESIAPRGPVRPPDISNIRLSCFLNLMRETQTFSFLYLRV